MRCLPLLIVFVLFSITPNTAQFRAFPGQRPTEEYEIQHETLYSSASANRDFRSKVLKSGAIRFRRQSIRPATIAKRLANYSGHRLDNGLLAPLRL